MGSSSLTLTLIPERRPGRFTLTWGTVNYPIEFRPETNVTLMDLLRRLHPVLAGGEDTSDKLAPYELLHTIGAHLWKALMPDTAPAEIRNALEHELRIGITPCLLALPPNLSVLPWELLYDPQQSGDAGFVARRRPLARLLPGDPDLLPLAPPLRVLLLISSPPGLNEWQRVDVESERAAIESATHLAREEGLLHLLVEDVVTPRQVQQVLLRFQPHILHYVGHGDYDRNAGGYLIWEDEQGEPFRLFDNQLADLLRDQGLRAVLLHGCQTATSDAHAEFRGVAKALLDAAIPSVLAQQANFTYESSQRTSEMFYTALINGLGLVEATFEARQALIQADRPDWAVSIYQTTAGGLVSLLDKSAPSGPSDPMLARSIVASDLPAPTGIFVGRQRELRALRNMLESTPGSCPVLALITGPGGMGKSTLAAQAVARYGRQYKGALTLDCASYQGIDRFLQRIGEFLKGQGISEFLEITLPEPKLSVAAKIEQAIAVLNQAGPFLFLLDNLEYAQDENRTLRDSNLLLLLQKALTGLQFGRVLVTGRYAVEDLIADGKFSGNLLRLDLDELSTREAHRLLTRYSTLSHLGSTVRTEIVREFGGLPYVYDLLSSRAAIHNLDSIIQDVQGRITSEQQDRAVSEWKDIRRKIVEFTALESIVARLPQQAYRLLGKLSIFRQPFPSQALEQGLAATNIDWQPLLDWGLLRYDSTSGTYHLHNLTADYAEQILDAADYRSIQVQVAEWYLRYAEEESHSLDDYLEAHYLLRTAGKVERACELATSLAPTLRGFGLFQLGHRLCTVGLKDIGNSFSSLAAKAQCELGKIASEQGQYEEARRLFGESLAICKQLGDQQLQASILRDLGVVALEQGQYAEAQHWLRESLAICKRLDDKELHAFTLEGLGVVALEQGSYKEAQKYFHQVLPIFKQLGQLPAYVTTLQNLGTIAQLQGYYEEAQRFYSEALPISKQLDVHGYAGIQHQLGIVAQKQRRFEEAQRFYSEALTIFEQHGIQRGRIDTLAQLGSISHQQERCEEAQRFYHESLSLSKLLGDLRGQGVALKGLAGIAKDQQLYNEAQQLYGETLAISEQTGDLRLRANTLYDLGGIANDQERYKEAHQLYSEALTIFRNLGILPQKAATLFYLGDLAEKQTQYEEAQQFYHESLTIYRQLDQLDYQTSILVRLGGCARQQRQYKEAQQFYCKALSLYKQLEDLDNQADMLLYLGNLAQEQGHFKKVLQYFNEALTIFKQLGNLYNQVGILNNLALLVLKQGQYKVAEQFCSEGLTICDQLGDLHLRASLMTNLGIIALGQEHYEKAQQFFNESLTLSERLDDQQLRANIIYYLGGIELRQERYEEAQQLYLEALSIYEQLEDLNQKANILLDLGDVAQEQRLYEKAGKLYRKALSIYEQLEDLDQQANTLHKLGVIAQLQTNYEEAQRLYHESLAISNRLGNQELWTTNLSYIGNLAVAQGHFKEAVQLYSQALTLMPNNALLYRNRAEALIHLRRLAEAEEDLARAVTLDGHENSPYLWYRRAQIAIARDMGILADRLLDETLETMKSDTSIDPGFLFDVALLRAQAAWLQGKLDAAQVTFQHVWEQANQGERAEIRREMERLFAEHPELAGQDIFRSIMGMEDE